MDDFHFAWPFLIPIVSIIGAFTYAIVPKDSKKASDLETMLEYAVGPGQDFAQRFVFARLPARVVTLAKTTIAMIGSS